MKFCIRYYLVYLNDKSKDKSKIIQNIKLSMTYYIPKIFRLEGLLLFNGSLLNYKKIDHEI